MQTIELSAEVRQSMLGKIKEFFFNEKDEEISEFQAGILLDFFLENIGPLAYNQAIEDAHKYMAERVEDMYGLQKRPR
ncbi:MAG: DUF2164 domain-containing protein [Bacillota bacterium]|jgi:uncharacterized protein (DUF2164 family)